MTTAVEPEDGLLGRIVRLNLLLNRALDDITARAGITFADYLVLGVVRRSPDRRSAPKAIAEVLDRTTGGMSLTLDRLEAVGYVKRARDTTDGRRVVVTLTARGLKVATSVNRALHQWERSLALSAGGADLAAALDELGASLRGDQPAALV